MKLTIKVYGEMHFNRQEVISIREKIVNDKADIILLESYDDDKDYYKIHSNSTIKRLEKTFNKKGVSLLKQFTERENTMKECVQKHVDKLLKDLEDDKENKTLSIQVGDTHLRTVNTKELGTPIFRKYLDSLKNEKITVNIYRSLDKEIS